MLAQLKLKLTGNHLNYYKSSNLQGVLYEKIDREYVEFLHSQQLHPYSQYVFKKGEEVFWCINTLNTLAYQKLILPLMNEEFKGFCFKNGDFVEVTEKKLAVIQKRELFEEFNSVEGEHQIEFEILTPMSFKQNGQYVIFPDLRLIYQSLMNKYDTASENFGMIDEETLEQLVENSKIITYRLRTARFPMEKMNMPGFMGKLAIRIKGTDTMKRYIRLLFRYGEYSGIGMKTALGMGAIRLVNSSNLE